MSAAADLFAAIPYARFLGVRAELADGRLRGVMPFSDHLIGNPVLPALHGGTLGAFLELTAIAELARRADAAARLPRTVGVTVEYLRSGRPRDTFAVAEVLRLGRRIANVSARAWQDDPDKPIALLHGRFLMPEAGGGADEGGP